MLNQVEFENSMKCDHELKVETEKQRTERLKKGLLELDADHMTIQNAQDIEDAGNVELAAFKFGSRITEADTKNITNTLQRKLDKTLVLLVQHKIGKDTFWLPPQGIRQEDETMREVS